MNFFRNIGNFISCILHENCEYSIKKILAYIFTVLIIYLAIWTDKNYYELLIFVAVLVGVRSYERVKSWDSPEAIEPPPTGEGEIGDEQSGINIDVDMKFKGGRQKPSSKRILTD